MPPTKLKFWDFRDAPDELRRLIPEAYANGWVALVYPGGTDEVIHGLMIRGLLSGIPVIRRDAGVAGVVLAGSHPPQPGRNQP